MRKIIVDNVEVRISHPGDRKKKEKNTGAPEEPQISSIWVDVSE